MGRAARYVALGGTYRSARASKGHTKNQKKAQPARWVSAAKAVIAALIIQECRSLA